MAICSLFPRFHFHVYENQIKNISAGAVSCIMFIIPACRQAAYFTPTTLKNDVHAYTASFGEVRLIRSLSWNFKPHIGQNDVALITQTPVACHNSTYRIHW